jgi:cytochrome c-type biogenesis protein CcmH
MTWQANPAVKLAVPLLLACSVALGAAPALADVDHQIDPKEYAEEFQGYVEGASYLEGRIRAPCCWNQTIDIHGSPSSGQLRREIRKRLRAGESTEQIEASIVARYGERILAVPHGNPLKDVAAGLVIAVLAAGGIAGVLVVRWRNRSSPPGGGNNGKPGSAGKAKGRDEWDERLDRELEKLDP